MGGATFLCRQGPQISLPAGGPKFLCPQYSTLSPVGVKENKSCKTLDTAQPCHLLKPD